MTVIELPTHGRWAWDARGDGRAVRVSTHAKVGLVNVSIWRGDVCVGTVRLQPDEAATLVAGLTEGLADLATASPASAGDEPRLRALEERVIRLESRRPAPAWRRAVDATRRLRRSQPRVADLRGQATAPPPGRGRAPRG
jgi:hypothetical protein